MTRFWILILLLSLVACNDVHIDVSKSGINTPGTDPAPLPPLPAALIWNFTAPSIRAGEEVPFSFSNGTGSITTDPSGLGTFDSSTFLYTPPFNTNPVSHTISATDQDGKSGSNTLSIAGFQKSYNINYPLTFGDQNYVSSSVSLPNGTTFIGAIVIDGTGYERWAINKTSDYGLTWQMVDLYTPDEDGESHPLSLTAKGTDVYGCGYSWGSGWGSTWVVRKTTDGGATWSLSDIYEPHTDDSHVCFDIEAAANGNLYAVGYNDTDGGVIRESVDDGATWTTIGTIPSVTMLVSLKVSPLGVVWAVGRDGTLWKGTFSLGSWNWVNTGTISTLSNTIYQQYGELELVSETEAYFSGVDTRWRIRKTTDGGANWSVVYVGAANTRGHGIKKLSTGEIVSIGSLVGATFSDPVTFKIVQSTDNGDNWNETYSDVTVSKRGITVTEADDGSVLAFGVQDKSPYQILNLRSTDGGASWSDRSIVYFWDNLYTTFNDFQVDGAGNLWATAWLFNIDSNYREPWVVMKSTDNGANWTASESMTDPANHMEAISIAIGPSDEVYVVGKIGNNYSVRKSSDAGATWNTVDTYFTSWSNWKSTVSGDGTVYYGGPQTLGMVDIRRGAASGTAWSTINTFPVDVAYSNFSLREIKAFDDNSVWVAGTEMDGSSVTSTAIYRSLDAGLNFTEVYRATGASNEVSIKKLSNGDIMANTDTKIIKTSDNGTSWQDVYDGTAVGASIKGFQVDSLDRIYVLFDNDQIYAQNQFNGSWFKMYDYSLINLFNYREILRITDCGNPSEVCLITTHARTQVGVQVEMFPLVVP